jgi:hypothetical protein
MMAVAGTGESLAMDPWFLFFLAVAIGAFIVVVIAAVALRSAMMLHFKGAPGGWSKLAATYATAKPQPSTAWKAQTLVVGRVLYRNCVTVAACESGLYLKLGFPLAVLGRPALFIPWRECKRLDQARLYWREAVLLSLGEPPSGTVTMPANLFAKIAPYVHGVVVDAR